MTTATLALSVRADGIPADGRRFRLEATEAECRAFAEELQIVDVASLAADLEVSRLASGAFAVRGAVTATVVQADIVTLEPVRQVVDEAIDVTLVAAEEAEKRASDSGSDEEADSDAPDLFSGGMIDLGAMVKEHMALGLDLYPRAPGVEFADHIEDDPAAEASPFAALQRLKALEE